MVSSGEEGEQEEAHEKNSGSQMFYVNRCGGIHTGI